MFEILTNVSQYINGNHQKMSADTREKIKKAIEKLNYRPSKQAQFLTTRKSNLIGVVVADISNMYSSFRVVKNWACLLGR